jgi:hypothetical protein
LQYSYTEHEELFYLDAFLPEVGATHRPMGAAHRYRRCASTSSSMHIALDAVHRRHRRRASTTSMCISDPAMHMVLEQDSL